MPPKLIAIALVCAGLPLAAWAAPQHPSETARDHPAPGAHANAVSGQASAARIEACMHATDALLSNIEKSDSTAAAADFSDGLKPKVDPAVLHDIWPRVTGQAGKLLGRGTPQNAMVENDVVVVLPLHFEKVDLNFQVACNDANRIDGFFLRPASLPPGSAPAASG